jgi:HEAT repeat protein
MKRKIAVVLAVLMFTALASAQGTGYRPWRAEMRSFQSGTGQGAGTGAGQGRGQGSADEQTYQAGLAALEQGQFRQAEESFAQVASRKGGRADAALYWQAYAQNKQGRRDEALQTIAQLRRSYPQSTWLKAANTLQLEIRQATGNVNVDNVDNVVDEETKLLALNSLMNMDEERAVPLLEKFLAGNHSAKLKDRAVFVLAQSGSPRARSLLSQIALGKLYPEAQMKAVRYLGVNGNDENLQILANVYGSTTDARIKREVLRSYGVAGAGERLAAVVRSEKDPELRREAIRGLGIAGEHEELGRLYKEVPVDSRDEILQSMGIAGDRPHLLEVARTETNAELRHKAIRGLGIAGGTKELGQLYKGATSAQMKIEVLEAMGIAGAVNELIEAARSEQDPEVRRKAIHSLGITGGKRAGDVLVELYKANSDAETRSQVVQALFIQGNDTAMIALARAEKDPAMRRELIQKLSLMGSKEAAEYMMELLNK